MSSKCIVGAGFSRKEMEDAFNTSDAERVDIDTLKGAAKKQELKKYQAKKQAIAIMANINAINAHPEGLVAGIEAVLTKDRFELSGRVSVENHQAVIRNIAHGELNEMMAALRPKVHRQVAGIAGGSTRTEGQVTLMRNTVKELMGEASNDGDASSFAAVWKKTADMLRTRMNKAGGDIAEKKGWVMPQTHDSTLIGQASRDDWISFTKERIDLDSMGLSRMDDQDVDLLLSELYDNFSTDGGSRLQGRGLPKNLGEKIVNRHNQERFMEFKNADAWLDYQERFGSQNLYRTMTDYIDTMAKNIALAEIMGPNPAMTMDYMRTAAKKQAKNLADRNNAGWRAQQTFDILRGKANGEGGKFAQWLSSFRNINVATKLGGALLSAATDSGFMAQTARYNGLKALAPMKRYLSAIAKMDVDEMNKFASRLAISAEYAVDRGLAAHDYSKNAGSQWSRNLAETVMKVSGLASHTQLSRASFGIEFVSELTRLSSKDFSGLGSKMQKAMKRYGIDSKEWNSIRSSQKIKRNGEEFLDPLSMDIKTQAKFVGMIDTETSFAVPTPDARVRSFTSFGSKSGTNSGELVRTAMQFKAFPLTMMMTHLGRGMAQSSMLGKASYIGSMIAMTTAIGSVIVQAKELAKGKTLMDWNDPHLWVSAFRQGGGLGIFGDFITNNGATGHVASVAQQIAGPTFGGSVQDIYEVMAFANFEKLSEGDYSGFSKNAVDFVINNFPGANIWYARLAIERGLTDHLKRASNPKYDREMRKRMRKMRKETGQKYWFKPQ